MNTKKLFTLTLIVLFCSSIKAMSITIIKPDTNLSIIDKGVIQVKLSDGKHKFSLRDYRGALTVFRSIIIEAENNASAYFWIAKCHYQLESYFLAKKYAEKAFELNPEINDELYFVLGQTYHRLGELDKAISDFKIFKSRVNEKLATEYEVDTEIKRCDFARKKLSNPIDVKITSIGSNINTRYDDKSPVMTSDGKTIYFTSRRSGNGGHRDEQSDFLYYEMIFSSTWDEETNTWGEAELVEGKVNTDGHTAISYLSPDDEYMYLVINIDMVTGSSDIWYSKKSNSGKWGSPKPVTPKFSDKRVNSTYYEGSCSLTGDGSIMYFVSERPGGNGQSDIYSATRIGKHDWSEPVNMGPVINSYGDENTVFVTADGNHLFYCSNGLLGMGGYDIFRSDLIDGKWSVPVNLGYPINSVGDDSHFIIGANGKGYYCASKEDVGEGSRDIYEIDFTNYDPITAQ